MHRAVVESDASKWFLGASTGMHADLSGRSTQTGTAIKREKSRR